MNRKIAVLLAAAVILWLALCLWAYGTVFLPGRGVYTVDLQTAGSMKECYIDDEQYYVSQSDDAWILLGLKSARYNMIALEIEDIVGNLGEFQIFYAGAGEFTEAGKRSFKPQAGVNYISLEGAGRISRIRLDLAEYAGVKIKIGSVQLARYDLLRVGRFYILYVICYVLAAAGMCICWRSGKTVWESVKSLVLADERHGRRSFLLMTSAVTVLFAAVYGKLLIGESLYAYCDIGGDTVNQYIPIIYRCISTVRDGRIDFWNYANICGSVNLPNGYLLNPFLLFVILMGCMFGEQTVVYWLVLAQYGQMLISAVICYKLLELYGCSDRAKIVTSICFAFNGFAVLWGQHYMFGIYVTMAAAVIYCVESYVRRQRTVQYLWMAAAVGICGLISVYMTYMILITAGFYALYRIIKLEAGTHRMPCIKNVCSTIGKLLSAVVLGLGVSAVCFVPGVIDLLHTSARLESDTGLIQKIFYALTDPYSFVQVKGISVRFLSNNLFGIAEDIQSYANYYEIPQLFFSCFSISIFVQYLFLIRNKNSAKLQKITAYTAFCLVLFLIYNKAGSMAYNGFVEEFGRYTFAVMPILAAAFAVTFDDILVYGRYSRIGLVISSAVNAYLLFESCRVMPAAHRRGLALLVAVNAAAGVFFLWFSTAKKNTRALKNRLYAGFFLILTADLLIDSYLTVNARNTLGAEAYSRSQTQIETVSRIIEDLKKADPGYYRIEKTFIDFSVSDAYMEGYDGITGYNSTMYKGLQEFQNHYMPGMYTFRFFCMPSYDMIPYQFDRLGLLGVKYILSDREMPDYGSLLSLKDVRDGYYIYQNRLFQSFHQYYSRAYDYDAFVNKSYAEKTDILKEHIIIEKTSDCQAEKNIYVRTADDVTEAVAEKTGEGIIVFRDIDRMKEGKTEEPFMKDEEYLSASFSIKAAEEVSDVMAVYTRTGNRYEYRIDTRNQTEYEFLLPEHIDRIEFADLNSSSNYEIEDFKIRKNKRSDEISAQGHLYQEGDQLSGNVKIQQDGYIFVPIVYQDGWELEVDGKPGELIHADSGFMAFWLEQGSHNYCIRYNLPGKTAGIYVTILSIIGTAVVLAMDKIFWKADQGEKGND